MDAAPALRPLAVMVKRCEVINVHQLISDLITASRAEIYVLYVPGGMGNRASFPEVGADVIQFPRQSLSIHIRTKTDAGVRARAQKRHRSALGIVLNGTQQRRWRWCAGRYGVVGPSRSLLARSRLCRASVLSVNGSCVFSSFCFI